MKFPRMSFRAREFAIKSLSIIMKEFWKAVKRPHTTSATQGCTRVVWKLRSFTISRLFRAVLNRSMIWDSSKANTLNITSSRWFIPLSYQIQETRALKNKMLLQTLSSSRRLRRLRLCPTARSLTKFRRGSIRPRTLGLAHSLKRSLWIAYLLLLTFG